MENYISVFVALLENLGHLTEKEAEKVAQELKTITLASQYKEVSHSVKDVLEKAKNK